MKTKGLSLAEAHTSGRKYRRACWGPGAHYRKVRDDDPGLATDYELEPEAKLLTREDIKHAFNISWSPQAQMYMRELLLEALFGSEEDV